MLCLGQPSAILSPGNPAIYSPGHPHPWTSNDLFFDYTLRTVALGAGILGLVSGALGSFAVLRKQSLMGDAISHAALPGIVLAFMLTRSKASLVLVLGAAIAGWLGMLLVLSIVRYTRIKEDSALGLVLSVFFGFGLLLLTFVQRWPDATQAGLDKFLFGQAAALLAKRCHSHGPARRSALLIMALFWKEFKLFSFDREFGATLGFPVRALDILLTTLLVTAIVIGLQAVGVVLMSAMIVAPAAAARQWTDKLSVMVALAGFFGVLAGVSGAVISSTAAGFSTGPVIVLSASVIVLFSLLFAPNRGLVWNWVRQRRNRSRPARRCDARSALPARRAARRAARARYRRPARHESRPRRRRRAPCANCSGAAGPTRSTAGGF